MARTLGREVISTRQRKIAELAQREPKLTLTTLAHHVDEVWMHEAYRRVRKDAAAGVDGVTAVQYEADLEANLSGLLERFKSGRYRASAVRRVHLEKPGTSKTRPIGIPTLEDKILQRAVLMVLEPVYEQDFLDCSYGFRPGRGAHQALQSLREGLMEFGGGWVIELDIEDFFGSVDWGHLRSFLDRRVRDGVIRRAIGKWLNAGVMEAGELSYPQRTLKRIAGVLRRRWHDDIWVVGRWLGRVVNGWLNYYAVPGSGRFIRGFARNLLRLWHRALRRRSQRDRFAWKKIERMKELLWPPVTIRHPWPNRRFAVTHPR